MSDQDLEERCRGIELLVADVDGVMTDGVIVVNDQGEESKHFHVRDGTGFVLWHRAGKRSAIISGRSAEAVVRRAAELEIDLVFQGIAHKARTFRALLGQLGLDPRQACFVGDDLADLSIFGIPTLGLAACPADAAPEILGRAHLVTRGVGGRAVIREVVETILKAQGRWNSLIDGYLSAID
jgi:3-deoxy-D-manno-octulosonate 8-phosphate phosphatase (KDO 8-P phosphatase)